MGRYMDFYDSVEAPLMNDSDLQSVIDTFAWVKVNLINIYKRKERGEDIPYNHQMYDKLYSSIFNEWKRKMIFKPRSEWLRLIDEGVVQEDIFDLISYLVWIPNVTTFKEAKKYFYGEKQSLMHKYGCFQSANNFGTYLCSFRTTAFNDKEYKTEHRLYVNVNEIDLHEFIYVFINTCQKYNLPYSIKYYEGFEEDDKFIIYSDTDHLLQYIEVLKEIEKNHPSLIERLNPPPILTGKIPTGNSKKWVGYGSEPLDVEKDSFNNKRRVLFQSVLDNLFKEWILDNKDQKIELKNGDLAEPLYLSIGEYIAINYLEKMIELIKKKPGLWDSDSLIICYEDLMNISMLAILKRL